MVSQTLTVLPMTHKPIAPQPRTQMSTRSFMGEAFVVTGLVLFACWLRVYLAQGGTFGSDVDDWITWSHALTNSPPSTFYARTNSDYLPGYPSILWLLGVMYPFVHSAVSHTFGWHINQMMFLVTYFKMPAITADLATIITIYIAGRRWTTWRRALVAASIYAINPAIIFNSARWGQVDSVSALFLVLAVVFLVEDLPLWCGFLLAVSIMTKPTAIVLVPLVIVMYARQKRLTRLILALSTLTLTSLLIAWPYKPATMSPITFIFQRFTTTATKWPVTSMNAFNLWALFNHDLGQHAMIFRLDSTHWLGLSLHLWGFMLLSALVAVLMVALAFIGVPDKKTQRAQVVVPHRRYAHVRLFSGVDAHARASPAACSPPHGPSMYYYATLLAGLPDAIDGLHAKSLLCLPERRLLSPPVTRHEQCCKGGRIARERHRLWGMPCPINRTDPGR